jgi:DNA polymerase-1
MKGDAVDNIPGLPGVGDKTAKKFINLYGSMEGLIENTHELKGKMKEKVEANAELGLLSKKLATILLDVPVAFDAKNFELDKPDHDKVNAIFQELEFRRLIENFRKTFAAETPKNQEEKPTKQAVPIKNNNSAGTGQFSLFDAPQDNESIETSFKRASLKSVSHFYQFVESDLAFDLFFEQLQKQKSVCFDTETTHLDALQAELVGIAFSWEAHKGFYVPFPEDQLKAQLLIDKLRPFFENDTSEKIGQNLKYDLKVLRKYNLSVEGPLFDTMIAHYLINPDMRHNMNVLAETYLNYSPQSIEELIGKKGKNQKTMREVPVKEVAEYAVEDADITFQLAQHFKKEMSDANTLNLFNSIEIPLIKVLADMELEGIRLDVDFLNGLSSDLDKDISALEESIYNKAGEVFNIASPKQLGVILFEKLKLVDKPKKTKTGQYSTAEDVLSYLAKDHEIIRAILEYRGLAKLKSTYVDALPEQVLSKTGHIHTEYLQTVAATGRLSSINPNLQNIPIRTERGRQVRKAFIPKDEHHILLAADYSQIELRVIAALSKEETMIQAFKNGEDIHASTASKVFNVPLEEVTREQRSNAKTVNFGIIYGVSAFGLSNQTDLSRTEAKTLIDTYYATYPKLRAYMADQVDFARDNGYVKTISERRRYLKDINSRNAVVRGAAERNAVNAPIQGSAADIIKIAMIRIHDKLKNGNYKSKMLLQVHDELVFDVYMPELERIKRLIKEEMESAHTLNVPLDVEIDMGANWLEAH